MPTVSGNVGAVGPPAGSFWPVADKTGVTVDTTTYNNSVKGAGKLTTLVFPAETGTLAMAISGDAFPRWIITADPHDAGLAMGDGTVDPFLAGTYCGAALAPQQGLRGNPADLASAYAQLGQLSPHLTISSGALPTQQLVSGAGAQVSTSRDVETYTPLTLTTAGGTVVVALSPDNVTYSTVMTVTPAVNASVTDVTVRVPAAWYLKMTATNATLGLTTYA